MFDQDADVSIDGFGAPFCLDWQAKVTRKTQGGGVYLYINKQYCNPCSVTVRECVCTPDVKLSSVSLRPFYLPREFSQVFITIVYIHPKANVTSGLSIIFDEVQKLRHFHPRLQSS